MINFRLKELEKINPVGQEPNLYLSWYWLTDGELWLTFGNETIFEYTKEALTHFGGKSTPFNDYYLVQFLDDFSQLFEKIGESLPTEFYDLTKDLNKFYSDARKWLEIYDISEDEYPDFYFDEYDKVFSWRNERTFDSIHLIGGPSLSFFRSKENIRIVWDTEHTLENGISVWTAKNGNFEMDYFDFVSKVKIFGEKFFNEMDRQLELTIAKEWDKIKVDKVKLLEEHKIRRLDFDKNLSFLYQHKGEQTDWTEIQKLIDRMTSEIK